MEQFGHVVRNFVVLIMSVLGLAAFVGVNLIMMPTNYLAANFGFYLLGYDGMPVEMDQLLGPYMGSIGEAVSVTQFYAVVLTLACSLGLFVAFHSLNSIIKLWFDRKSYLYRGDAEGASVAMNYILKEAFLLFIIWVPALAWALKWDMDLFRLRSIAGALALEDPAVAATIQNWEEQIRKNSGLWAWDLAFVGGWGYVAVTALACSGVEFMVDKVSNAWARVVSSIEALVRNGDDRGRDDYWYEGQWEPEEDQQMASPIEPDGNSSHTANGYHEQRSSSGEEQALWEPAASEGTEAEGAEEIQAAREQLYDVIGGAPGERVSIRDALADKMRYWVDMEGPQVWDATYRKALFTEALAKAA